MQHQASPVVACCSCRTWGRIMSVVIHSLFSESYVAVPGTKRPELDEIISLDDVLVVMSKDLQNDVSAWEEKHFERIGMAEFAAKGDCGVGAEARVQAQSVGATLVLFSIWPVKLKSIRKAADGSIDIASVVANPPAGLSPRGYYVLKAEFLRPNPSFHRICAKSRASR